MKVRSSDDHDVGLTAECGPWDTEADLDKLLIDISAILEAIHKFPQPCTSRDRVARSFDDTDI